MQRVHGQTHSRVDATPRHVTTHHNAACEYEFWSGVGTIHSTITFPAVSGITGGGLGNGWGMHLDFAQRRDALRPERGRHPKIKMKDLEVDCVYDYIHLLCVWCASEDSLSYFALFSALHSRACWSIRTAHPSTSSRMNGAFSNPFSVVRPLFSCSYSQLVKCNTALLSGQRE